MAEQSPIMTEEELIEKYGGTHCNPNREEVERYWREACEEGERIMRTYRSLLKRSEKEIAEREVAIAEMDLTIAEYNLRIAEQNLTIAEQNLEIKKMDLIIAKNNLATAETRAEDLSLRIERGEDLSSLS